MKTRILAVLLVCAAVFVTGCSDEGKLTPSDPGNVMDRFDFPQGNNAWDDIFAQIYEDQGVRIIYKDFTDNDWQRTWTATGESSIYSGDRFSEAELLAAAEFIDSYFFSFFAPGQARNIFKPYIFLVKDLKINQLGGGQEDIGILTAGLDCWVMSPRVGDNVDASNREAWVYAKVSVFCEMISGAVNDGTIVMPEEFYSMVDYTTTTRSSSSIGSNPSYYSDFTPRRGFLGILSNRNGDVYCTDYYYNFPGGMLEVSTLDKLREYPGTEVSRFVMWILYDEWFFERFKDGRGWENCPILEKRVEILLDTFKDEYDIDLMAYKDLVWNGYTGDPMPAPWADTEI